MRRGKAVFPSVALLTAAGLAVVGSAPGWGAGSVVWHVGLVLLGVVTGFSLAGRRG